MLEKRRGAPFRAVERLNLEAEPVSVRELTPQLRLARLGMLLIFSGCSFCTVACGREVTVYASSKAGDCLVRKLPLL